MPSYRYGRRVFVLVLPLVVAVCSLCPLYAQQPAAQSVATADQLKTMAFQALKEGKFELTNDYLSRAASLTNDSTLTRMAAWTRQFEEQRQVFVSERNAEYEKAVKEAHLLLEKGKPLYAVGVAARAYSLSSDKDAFRKEPWVVQLLATARAMADDLEKSNQWVKSFLLYGQLAIIEPDVQEWNDRLKATERRLRLYSLYTPDQWKKLQEPEVREREEVEAILHPEKQTTRPATRPGEEESDVERIDWRDQVRDISMDLVTRALVNARASYFRDVGYRTMLIGGLKSLRILTTTPGLEVAFTSSELSKPAPRAAFLGHLDAAIARCEKAREQNEAELAHSIIVELREANDRTIRLPEQVLAREFAEGAFAALDPFSQMIWPADMDEFNKQTQGQFSGVGIQIQTDESGYLKVVNPLEDSPAWRAGVKPDYLVTHIDGKSTRWLSLNQAVRKITGPPGTTVTLTIRDTKGNVKDYKLERSTIKIESIKGYTTRPGGGWDFVIDPEQKIGYIRMAHFQPATTEDLDKAVAELSKQGVKGIILDLRHNPGGLLPTAISIVDRFISKGIIVSTRADREDSPNGPSSYPAKNDGDEIKMDVIVLVNQLSASASEILSGALKDHKRALIVGERTFGKGSVQVLYPLANRQAYLKLTTSHYYLPSGKCIHREEGAKEWGVDPDIRVEMTPEQMRAAMETRQEYDIRRDAADASASESNGNGSGKKKRDLLASDAQLSAALLLMRLQLAGAQL